MYRIAALFSLCFISYTHAGLQEYVNKKDDSFTWKMTEKTEAASGASYRIEMTSQTWQGIKWEHVVMIYMPKEVKPEESMVLWNDGGKPNAVTSLLGFEMAKRAKVPVMFVYGIPNQPLFEGKREDALIAETLVRYLKSEDEDWPLLFPMVKSLVRAMDAVQAFAKSEWKKDVKSFVVSGASKRGWTSWLTGAADPRVKAICPMVIDTLNFQKQLPHQVASFGKPSEMIKDYTERGLVPIPKGGAGEKLWQMIDPWAYREKLTLPKMIVNGANDPYWSQDALNLYWDDLKGDKWILYVPNAGHGLEQTYDDGKKDRARVLGTLAMFSNCQVTGKAMPKLSWKHDDVRDQMRVAVTCDTTPKAVRLWVADAPTRDFRKAKWTIQEAKLDKTNAAGFVDKPKSGWRTFFAEYEFDNDGTPYFLSTQLRMCEAGK